MDFLANMERKIQAFKNKSLRRLLQISYKEHKIFDFI